MAERRVRIYIEPRDWWIGGVYISDSAVYVCLLPCVVLKIRRQAVNHHRTKGDSRG